jgi:predicted NBD/HSP70 family sugar kinase
MYTLIYMYLGIDVGATKTLLAVFEPDGEMVCEEKIKTDPDYQQFRTDLADCLKKMDKFEFTHACCALPGTIDFESGTAVAFGNENWHDIPVRQDLVELLPGIKVLIHNDAKLAGLSEANLIKDKYKRVLYITISTGIGGGVTNDGKIDTDFNNFEPGQMVFEFEGKLQQWEDFASGRALKARYGKIAAEIQDPEIWKKYVKSLTAGFENVLATVQPEAIVIGGGVGAHFEKFKPYLDEERGRINNPLVPVPPILKAQRPEEAVIYGCYDYIKQNV